MRIKLLSLENILVAILVAIPLIFNLYFLKPELGILHEVNDNVFAYALAYRMNEAWTDGGCPIKIYSCLTKLTDHWVSYWAMGYPLPQYYQHLPSIINVTLFRLLAALGVVPNTISAIITNPPPGSPLHNSIFRLGPLSSQERAGGEVGNYSLPGLFIVFNWVKYLLLSFFPLSVYWAARKFKFPKLAAAFSALCSILISTNFQYGTDYGSIIWRGSGMHTQLWGLFFLPLALGSLYETLTSPKINNLTSPNSSKPPCSPLSSSKLPSSPLISLISLIRPGTFPDLVGIKLLRTILLLVLTFQSHILFGYIAALSSLILLLTTLISLIPLISPRSLIKNKEMSNRKSEHKFTGSWYQRIIELSLTTIKLLKSPLIIISVVYGFVFLLTAYWIIPMFINDAYHAHSVWDELYKFNSFGAKEVINRYFDGAIFDYGRFPILTILVFLGFFFALNEFINSHSLSYLRNLNNLKPQLRESPPSYLLFPLLLVFWTLLYFGRTTWGPLTALLPGSEGIHMHRFINGIHFAGIFLSGLGLHWILLKAQTIILRFQPLLTKAFSLPDQTEEANVGAGSSRPQTIAESNQLDQPVQFAQSPPDNETMQQGNIQSYSHIIILPLLLLLLLFPAFRERYEFLKVNTDLIKSGNIQYLADWPDFQKTLNTLNSLMKTQPGRIWAGRPGNWGKEFKVGSASTFLILSLNGYDTLGFEPESWSPNTDLEQFFNDSRLDHYNLFNIKYILAPPDVKFPDFAKQVSKHGKYALYQVPTSGNFAYIASDLTVSGNKFNTLNFIRFWVESNWPELGNHPTLTYSKVDLNNTKDNNIQITDWVSYKRTTSGGKDLLPLSLLDNNIFNATPSSFIHNPSASPKNPSDGLNSRNAQPEKLAGNNNVTIGPKVPLPISPGQTTSASPSGSLASQSSDILSPPPDSSNSPLSSSNDPLLDSSNSPLSSSNDPLTSSNGSVGPVIPSSRPVILSESSGRDTFSARVRTGSAGLLMLKATYHPFWKATVNGQEVPVKMVAPYFMAINLPPGESRIQFTYQSAGYKNLLLLISLTGFLVLAFFSLAAKKQT